MEWKDILGELVTFIKTASPEVWRIMLKQVYVVAVQDGIAVACCVVLSILTFKWGKAATRKYQEDDDMDNMVALTFSWLGFGVAALVAVICFAAMVSRLINPEFYVISYLLSAIGGN